MKIQVLKTDVKMKSIVVYNIMPSLKDIGLKISKHKSAMKFFFL